MTSKNDDSYVYRPADKVLLGVSKAINATLDPVAAIDRLLDRMTNWLDDQTERLVAQKSKAKTNELQNKPKAEEPAPWPPRYSTTVTGTMVLWGVRIGPTIIVCGAARLIDGQWYVADSTSKGYGWDELVTTMLGLPFDTIYFRFEHPVRRAATGQPTPTEYDEAWHPFNPGEDEE